MIYNAQCILLPSIRLNITRSADLMRNFISIFVNLLFCKSSAESGQGSIKVSVLYKTVGKQRPKYSTPSTPSAFLPEAVK